MVIGNMQHTRSAAVVVSAEKIIVAVVGHIGCGNRNILIPGDIHTPGVVHLVVAARGDGEAGEIPLAVIEHRGNIRREHRLIILIHRNRRVRPPEKGLRQGSGVREAPVNLQHRPFGIQAEPRRASRTVHRLPFTHPHRNRSVLGFPNFELRGRKRGGPVVLRPVELDSPGDPRPGEAHQGRFNHPVVVHEVIIVRFIQGHLHPAAQLRQNHDLEIAVLQKHRLIGAVALLIGNGVNHLVGINRARTALINPFFEKHRVRVRAAGGVSWNRNAPAPRLHRIAFVCVIFRGTHIVNPTTKPGCGAMDRITTIWTK